MGIKKIMNSDSHPSKPTTVETGSASPGTPLLQNLPIGTMKGEAITSVPLDLYIPPDALQIFLETFEGPLDLLLYLIKKQNMDILDVSIADVTIQYMQYVELMKNIQLELAADYLVMAAMLAEIKSRMLLPRPVEEDDEDDPRAELIRRLQEYERYKSAAQDLNELPRLNREVFQLVIQAPEIDNPRPEPQLTLDELLLAFNDVLKRADLNLSHQIQMEPLSVRERMSMVLSQLTADKFTSFHELFTFDEGRLGVVVTFLAILELIKESIIELVQTEPFEPIHVKITES